MTEPGNMASSISTVQDVINMDRYATFDHFSYDSPRLWTIPIIQSMTANGRGEVLVVGFAEFFIENIGKKSGQSQVTGRFVQFTANGDMVEGQQDFGVYGVKLIDENQ